METKAVTITSFGNYAQTEVSSPLRASGGDRGGQRNAGYLLYQETVGSLQAVDYKGPNRQYVKSGKLIIEIWN